MISHNLCGQEKKTKCRKEIQNFKISLVMMKLQLTIYKFATVYIILILGILPNRIEGFPTKTTNIQN